MNDVEKCASLIPCVMDFVHWLGVMEGEAVTELSPFMATGKKN